MSRHSYLMSRQRGGQRERFGVAIGNFMLRHSWPIWEDFLS